jgi:hypothetical protein
MIWQFKAMNNKVSLVTLQDRKVTTQIFNQQLYRARRFSPGPLTDPCMTSYRWMAQQMMRRGLSTNGHLPIWCWSHDFSHGPAPRYIAARALLSDLEIMNGVRVISLSVPISQCLITDYGWWNDVVDTVMSGGKPPRTLPRRSIRSFCRVHDLSENPAQVCIPFIAQGWILAVRPLEQFITTRNASLLSRRLMPVDQLCRAT